MFKNNLQVYRYLLCLNRNSLNCKFLIGKNIKMVRKGKETTVEERKIIVNLRKQNKTIKEISEIVKRPKSTITSIISRHIGTGNY